MEAAAFGEDAVAGEPAQPLLELEPALAPFDSAAPEFVAPVAD